MRIEPHKNGFVRVTGLTAAQQRWVREEIKHRYHEDGAWFFHRDHLENLRKLGVPRSQPTTPSAPSDYAVLHLLPTAPVAIIDAVWRVLAKVHHPDTGGDAEVFKRTLAAYKRIKGGL